MRLNSLYECGCDKCKAERKINLATGEENPLFKKVLKAAENAFKHLHSKGSYKPEDITEKPYQKLIDETYKVFNSAITDNEIPPEMLAGLQSDAFLFGGLKTHAQLTEASTMLLDNGKVKSFQQFQNEFQQLNKKYNQNYLEAEYQFAVNSSQMAANWAGLDDSGRYNLQYRTAADNRVRAEHAALDKITLPKEDDFWLSYYPPNGWRCRCQAVEVRKSKFKESDSEKSIQKGEQATSQIGKDGKNKLEIFRFNPGKEEKLFPPKHPYNKLKGADVVADKLARISKNEFIPRGLEKYQNDNEVEINTDIFKLLNKSIPLERDGKIIGYNKTKGIVILPEKAFYDNFMKQNIIYHEYGHAIDHAHDLRSSKIFTDTFERIREKFYANNYEIMRELDVKIKEIRESGYKDYNSEEVLPIADTLMCIHKRAGWGHDFNYMTEDNQRSEFIARSFENKFLENKTFKKLAPQLHAEMINLVDEFIKEIL